MNILIKYVIESMLSSVPNINLCYVIYPPKIIVYIYVIDTSMLQVLKNSINLIRYISTFNTF